MRVNRVTLGGMLLALVVWLLTAGCGLEERGSMPEHVQPGQGVPSPSSPAFVTPRATDSPFEAETCDVCSRKAEARSTATPVPTEDLSVTVTLCASPSTTPTCTPIHRPATDAPTHISAPAIGLDAPVIPVGLKEVPEDGVLVKRWAVADLKAVPRPDDDVSAEQFDGGASGRLYAGRSSGGGLSSERSAEERPSEETVPMAEEGICDVAAVELGEGQEV